MNEKHLILAAIIGFVFLGFMVVSCEMKIRPLEFAADRAKEEAMMSKGYIRNKYGNWERAK